MTTTMEDPRSDATLAEAVKEMHVSTVDVKPRDADWRELDIDDWSWVDSVDFHDDERNETVLLVTRGGSEPSHIVIDGSAWELADWEAYADHVGEWSDETADHNLPVGTFTPEDFNRYMEVEPYQRGAEGPMMNYWYPIKENDSPYGGFDEYEAAATLKDLPLCLVQVDDEWGLALTGGGMDLSWEICAAYVALGKLPPIHFSDLPRFGDQTGRQGSRRRIVVHAMRRSLEVSISWAQRKLQELNAIYG